MKAVVSSGISPPFGRLSQSRRQIIHVLLTRAPLCITCIATRNTSSDLHVLGTPPAFVLSQNQTLQLNLLNWCPQVTIPQRVLFIVREKDRRPESELLLN